MITLYLNNVKNIYIPIVIYFLPQHKTEGNVAFSFKSKEIKLLLTNLGVQFNMHQKSYAKPRVFNTGQLCA